MRYKHLIWDLDGTLIFTPESFIFQVVQETLESYGLNSTPDQAKQFWYGSNRDEIIAQLWKLSKKQFWPEFGKHNSFERRTEVMRAYPDVHILGELNQRGHLQAMLTGASIRTIEVALPLLESVNNFQATLSARPPRRFKPHPEGLDILLEILGAHIDTTLLIGNGQEDIDCGRAVGVDTCLLDRKEYDMPDNLNPTYRINSLTELRDLV